ncbi:hypothetical protein MHBO_002212 [Bonamia ostreae]|uniref:Ribosomal protein L5 n=1 Tax=Bonamia ostreae TaxID=126728 RepID=A0ABV2ALL0_9EUKA
MASSFQKRLAKQCDFVTSHLVTRPDFCYHRDNVVLPTMWDMFQYRDYMKVPQILRVVVSIPAHKSSFVKSRTDIYAAMVACRLFTDSKPSLIERRISEAGKKGRKIMRIAMVQSIVAGDKALLVLEKLATKVFPNKERFHGFKDSFESNGKHFNYQFDLNTLSGLDELEYEAETFKRIDKIRVGIHTSAKSYLEAFQLLRLYQVPIVMEDPFLKFKRRISKRTNTENK